MNKYKYWLFLIPFAGLFFAFYYLIRGIVNFSMDDFTAGFIGLVFGVLVALSIDKFISNTTLFKEKENVIAKELLSDLVRNLEAYKNENGAYPVALQYLTYFNAHAPIKDPISRSGDRYRNQFNYILRDSIYVVFSSGQDRVPFTSDDLFPEIDTVYMSSGYRDRIYHLMK